MPEVAGEFLFAAAWTLGLVLSGCGPQAGASSGSVDGTDAESDDVASASSASETATESSVSTSSSAGDTTTGATAVCIDNVANEPYCYRAVSLDSLSQRGVFGRMGPSAEPRFFVASTTEYGPLLIGWQEDALVLELQDAPPQTLGDQPWLAASARDSARDDLLRFANGSAGSNDFEVTLFASGPSGLGAGDLSLFPQGDAYWPVASADIDGDGLDELVVTDSDADVLHAARLRILEWNGSGFQGVGEPVEFNEGCGYPIGVRVANVDGDAFDDIVVATDCMDRFFDPVLYILRGAADTAELEDQVDVVPLDSIGDAIEVADVSGDGIDDVLLSVWESQLSLLVGIGDGSFGEQVILWADGEPELALDTPGDWQWVVADLDGDGKKEILAGRTAIVDAATAPVFVDYLPAGALSPIEALVSAGDISGDGIADLILSTTQSNVVLISAPVPD